MARTTSTAVEGILEETPSGSLASFITTANLLVTKHCTHTDFTAAELEEIERYLAAHFYHVTNTRADMEKAGRVSQTLRSKVDMYLSLTHYGQTAIILDWSGALAALNQRMQKGISSTIGMSWLGKTEEEVEDEA